MTHGSEPSRPDHPESFIGFIPAKDVQFADQKGQLLQ